MRIQTLLIVILFACAGSIAAQPNGVAVVGNWADHVSITDVNGRPFEKSYVEVAGTPYFNPTYKFAKIILVAGQKFTGIQTKINLLTQETIFITANNIEAYLEKGRVKEISYSDTTGKGIVQYKFQTGFPDVDKQTVANFYQVLAEGRCSLLKSMIKNIAERKNELSGEIAKEFEVTEDYYLFTNNQMKRLKKDKAFILAQLPDRQTELTQFMQANKINCKNTDDLVKLINYYNSL